MNLPDWIDFDLWALHVAQRKELKRGKDTERALMGQIRKLERYRELGWDANKILQAAIDGPWVSVHMPEGEPPKQPHLKTESGKINDYVQKLIRRPDTGLTPQEAQERAQDARRKALKEVKAHE